MTGPTPTSKYTAYCYVGVAVGLDATGTSADMKDEDGPKSKGSPYPFPRTVNCSKYIEKGYAGGTKDWAQADASSTTRSNGTATLSASTTAGKVQEAGAAAYAQGGGQPVATDGTLLGNLVQIYFTHMDLEGNHDPVDASGVLTVTDLGPGELLAEYRSILAGIGYDEARVKAFEEKHKITFKGPSERRTYFALTVFMDGASNSNPTIRYQPGVPECTDTDPKKLGKTSCYFIQDKIDPNLHFRNPFIGFKPPLDPLAKHRRLVKPFELSLWLYSGQTYQNISVDKIRCTASTRPGLGCPDLTNVDFIKGSQ